MNQPKHRRQPSAVLLGLFSLLAFLFVAGCTFHASGSAKSSSSAKSGSSSSSKAEAKGSAKAGGKSSAKASGGASASAKASGKSSSSAKASGKSSGSAKASGKVGGSSKVVFKTKERASGMGKAKGGDHFKATVLVKGGRLRLKGKASGSATLKGKGSVKTGGKGSVKASGKASGKSSSKDKDSDKSKDKKDKSKDTSDDKKDKDKSKKDKSDDKKDKSKKDNKTEDKSKKDKSKKDKSDDKKDNKTEDKSKDKETDPPVVVIDPPAEPPDNDFGYEEPVRGCFEGIIYPLAPNTKKLPTAWNPDDGISVVYACEWDIPTRKWETGFPGVEDRFEWFAIQYTGAFSVAKAGKWKFRISSDDGAKLYIDGKLVLDNDGTHPPQSKEIEIDLTEGDHDMVLEYFQGPRYHINLQLFATPPGGEEGIFSVR